MIRITDIRPDTASYCALRLEAGWGATDMALAEAALDAALYCVSLYDDDALIGFGRIIGDGALNYYLQDLIVTRSHRGQGHGDRITQALLDWLTQTGAPEATIGLMAAHGKAEFYKRFGFRARPNADEDAGMTRPVALLEP